MSHTNALILGYFGVVLIALSPSGLHIHQHRVRKGPEIKGHLVYPLVGRYRNRKGGLTFPGTPQYAPISAAAPRTRAPLSEDGASSKVDGRDEGRSEGLRFRVCTRGGYRPDWLGGWGPAGNWNLPSCTD